MRPARKFSSARWRAVCDLLPWIASAETPLAFQHFRHFVGAVLGAGEDDGATDARVLENLAQQRALVVLFDEQDPLVDLVGGGGNRRHGHLDRIAQDAVGEARDLARHGRGEQQRLAMGGQGGDDLLDVVDEAHVEHAVGFVQDEGLDLVELDVALVHEVEQAAGAGDKDIHAARHGAHLRLLADAAEDHGIAHAEMAPIGLRSSRRSGGPARASASAPARAHRAGRQNAFQRAGAAGSAARRLRSCRCRSGRNPADPCRREDRGSPAPGSASASCISRRVRRAGGARSG